VPQAVLPGRNRHTIDESHLQSSLSEEMFDPLDYLDLGGGAIDLGLDLAWDDPIE
jgi:hypothetical protein